MLDRSLVKIATIIQTGIQDNSPAMPRPVQFPQFPQCNPRHHHQLVGRRIPTLPMGATRTIFKCGTQLWRHNSSNKVAKVKVSSDEAR